MDGYAVHGKCEAHAMVRRLLSMAANVGGEFFAYALDRLEQGVFTSKQPVYLVISDRVLQVLSWRDVFIKSVDYLNEVCRDQLMDAAKDFGNPYVALSGKKMRTAHHHDAGVFIELYLDPSSIVRNTRKLFKMCGVDLANVGIVYADRGTVIAEIEEEPIHNDLRLKAEEVNGYAYQYSTSDVRHQNFIGKVPLVFLAMGKEYSLDGNWRNLLVKTVDVLHEKDHERLIDSVKKFSASYFALSKSGMRQPVLHEESGVWIDRYLDPTNSVYYSRKLCSMCKLPLGELGIVYADKDADVNGVSFGRKNVPDVTCDASSFEKDIRQNYKNGFDFSDSSKRLVESRVGKTFSNAVAHTLQNVMFERKDGLWFFEDQISDAGLREEIAARCQQWLTENPIVVLNQFVDMVSSRVANIEDDFDMGKYAEYAILGSDFGRRCDFNGKRGGRICFLSESGADAAKKSFAERVEALLRDRFDMVPVSELADLYPMVSKEWMIGNLPELLPDAILEDIGDRSFAFKLLEFYYLPDDFADVFHSITEELSADDEVLSVARILNALSDHYGYDFKDNFALSENVFKQIASRVDHEHRGWTGAILGGIDDGGKERLTFRQIVEKQFPRVFSHEEFYRFGATAWGWSEDHRGWHHKQLWNGFIRYDAEHWSPVEYFKTVSGWNEKMELRIGAALTTLLGTSPFFPMSKVPQQFLDNLPDLMIEGRPVRWTLELLASVAYFCLPRVRVLNHAAAPYTVSSLLVPPEVSADVDGVAYMVHVFKLRNPYAPGGDFGDVAYQSLAMKFLLENDVRQKASQKLQAEVAELLQREVV